VRPTVGGRLAAASWNPFTIGTRVAPLSPPQGPSVMAKGVAKVVEDAFPEVKQVVITAFD
jgi:hypothetical protein